VTTAQDGRCVAEELRKCAVTAKKFQIFVPKLKTIQKNHKNPRKTAEMRHQKLV
jgi:hypothetical protein